MKSRDDLRLRPLCCLLMMATAMLMFADPYPQRPGDTNALAIIQSGVTNGTCIIIGKFLGGGAAPGNQAVGDVDVLRVLKAPPQFQSKRIVVGYSIGKYDPVGFFLKEKPRTNTFVLFLKPDDPSKEWYDATRGSEAFVEATEENVRTLEAKLGLPDSLEKSRHQKIIFVVVTILGIAALVSVRILWSYTFRRAQKISSVV